MSAKWTPGPWVVSDDKIVLVGKVGKRQEEFVADVYPSNEGYRGVVARLQSSNCIDGIDSDETKANTYLIAAAPEMYSMLEALKDEFLYKLSFDETSGIGALADGFGQEINDLLKKARGES